MKHSSRTFAALLAVTLLVAMPAAARPDLDRDRDDPSIVKRVIRIIRGLVPTTHDESNVMSVPKP